MKKYIKFFMIGIIMIVLAGCGNQEKTSDKDSIKIGSMFELTGAAAAYGTSMNNAVHMAAKEINDAGGINGKQVEIVEYDTKTDETEAASINTFRNKRSSNCYY